MKRWCSFAMKAQCIVVAGLAPACAEVDLAEISASSQEESLDGETVPHTGDDRERLGSEAREAIVLTDLGHVRGVVSNTHRTFSAIPFASPPVGELRWRAPEPAAPWSGVRAATNPGPRCAQNADRASGLPASEDEDCLYLNVTTPRTQRWPELRPVLVWIHGGGLSVGSGNDYEHDRLAVLGDLVVVSINYRLGIFGFFGHPGLDASGGFGLLDQQAALAWVKRNAVAFGGDPNNVTIVGQSAGADAVCAQLASPAAAGLFERAVIQSSACTTNAGPNLVIPGFDPAYETWKPYDVLSAIGSDVATTLGCSDPDTALSCLRRQPVADLLSATTAEGIPPYWSPAYGTPLLPAHPGEAVRTGQFNRVPVLQGVTRDEGTFFTAAGDYTWLTPEVYPELLEFLLGERAPEFEARYPLASYVSPEHAWAALITDGGFVCPSLDSSSDLAAYVPTYAYEFLDREPPRMFELSPGYPLGAYHAAEIPYFHGLAPLSIELSPAQARLSEQMIAYWSQFARTGDPNGPGLPSWPLFKDLGTGAAHVQGLAPGQDGIGWFDTARRHQCELWSQPLTTPLAE